MATMWTVISKLEKLAPSMYVPPGDANGIIIGVGDTAKQKRLRLKAAAVSLDVTIPVIFRSGELGATFLITHRSPFVSYTRFTGLAHLLLQQLIKRNISVYVVHLNWATVDGGMNDVLAHTLGFKVDDVFELPVNGTTLPLGRVCRVPKETSLKAFIHHVSKRLEIPSLYYIGNPDEEVERLALVAGQGVSTEWLHLAWEQGVDAYLTGHLTHELALQANQLKIKLVAVPQVATEIPGMSSLTQILRAEHPGIDFTFIEPSFPYSTFLT